MNPIRPIVVLLAICASACAQQPTQSSTAPSAASTKPHAQIDYAKFATATVGMFSFTSLYNWDSNEPGQVVVWTTPLQVYRLTLLGPCFELQHAPTIALTSHGGTVTSGLDSVLVRGEQCPIQRIQKLDGKALRAARKS